MDLSKALSGALTYAKEADTHTGSKSTSNLNPAFKVGGLSGTKIRILLNQLLSNEEAEYLEVGVYAGSTFVPALFENNPKEAYAVDNWSEFDGHRDVFIHHCETFLPGLNGKPHPLGIKPEYNLIEKDFFQTAVSDYSWTKFNVYFYDGHHAEESQYKALEHMLDIGCLANEFIFMVDDYGWEGVRRGTQNSIKDFKLNVLYEETLGVTDPMPPEYTQEQNENWWNGFYVSHLSL